MLVCGQLNHLQIIVATTFVIHSTGTTGSIVLLTKSHARNFAHTIMGVDQNASGGGQIDQG